MVGVSCSSIFSFSLVSPLHLIASRPTRVAILRRAIMQWPSWRRPAASTARATPAAPRPPPPEPAPSDCCQSAPPCADCVWDRYARDYAAWKAEVGEEAAAKAKQATRPSAAVASVDAFAALEARLEREAAERRKRREEKEGG